MLGIRSVLDLLFEPGSVFEIRGITDTGIVSGYYDQVEKAEGDVLLLDADKTTNGIYVTLNTVNPDLLARRANRLKTRLSKKDQTTADADIIRRRWFPIDIDPVRPSGVSSSEEEHETALQKADLIKTYLSELGWPEPIAADSGNGAHLLYHIDLPNDTESRDLIKAGLETLSTIFSDAKCNVDTANFNAARIWKLYGTVSRKGDNTPSRSHRRAAVTETPPEIYAVTEEQIRSLASLLPKDEPAKPTRKKPGQPIDLREWLHTYGLGYEQKPYSDGFIYILDECPFSSAHKDGAFVIQFSSGAIFAGCHHNSCGAGTQRWSELREIYEGKKSSRKTNPDNRNHPSGGAGAAAFNKKSDKKSILEAARNAPTETEEEIAQEALRILQEGDPLQFIVDTFGQEHIGDLTIANCFTLSFASRSCVNSLGLHVSISGESGKGKSHAMTTMSSLLPQDLACTNRMSDKALFYKTDLKPGSAICLDDQGLSEQMQEILKGVTTSFKKEFRYDTVNKDRAGLTLLIPERCVWWVAKVEGIGDDQVWNRMLSCWIDDSLEQDYKVMENALKNAASLPEISAGERRSVLICREIWNQLKSVYVVIPYAERIRFSDTKNRRNVDMLIDIIHALAALMQYQRSTIEHSGFLCVAATEEDFSYAADLYCTLAGETGGQITKMTKNEADLVAAIIKLNQTEFTTSDLQAVTTMSNSVINKTIQGCQSKGSIYTGLLDKCPAISYCDRTRTTGDEVEKTSRRARAYHWDQAVYKNWAGVGTVWLEPEDRQNNYKHLPQSGTERKSAETFRSEETKETDVLAESKPIEENKNLGAEHQEIIRETKLCAEDVHIVPVTEIGISALSEKSTLKPSKNGQNVKPAENIAAEIGAESPQRSAVNEISALSSDQDSPRQREVFSVKVEDYKKLDIPMRGPCDRCNARYVTYIEKLTPDRLATRKHEPARRICKTCYDNAKRKKSDSFRSLPGTLNIAGFSRTTVDLGRCAICDAQKATWRDPENRMSICDSCFAHAGGNIGSGVQP